MKFRKKPLVIEAEQWFKNGDHSEDYPQRMMPAVDWCEGLVVRYYRSPEVPGSSPCGYCSGDLHNHGWIDTLEGGHIVCPGDWVITGTAGERYPCKPDIFKELYEPVE